MGWEANFVNAEGLAMEAWVLKIGQLVRVFSNCKCIDYIFSRKKRNPPSAPLRMAQWRGIPPESGHMATIRSIGFALHLLFRRFRLRGLNVPLIEVGSDNVKMFLARRRWQKGTKKSM